MLTLTDDILKVVAYLSLPQARLIPCFLPFLRIFKSEFLIQGLLSLLIVNGNGISVRRNLNLGVDNQKQIKSRNLKMSPLFNGSSNTVHVFFYSPGIETGR